MASGEKTDLTSDWDYTIDEFAWAPDSRSAYFLAYRDGVKPMFNIGLDRTISVVAQGEFDYESISPLADGRVITMHHSMVAPNEIYSVKDGDVEQLSFVNKELLDRVTMPLVKRVMVPTTDGKEMLTWVILPPNFDEPRNIRLSSIAREVRSRLSASSGATAGTLPLWLRRAM